MACALSLIIVSSSSSSSQQQQCESVRVCTIHHHHHFFNSAPSALLGPPHCATSPLSPCPPLSTHTLHLPTAAAAAHCCCFLLLHLLQAPLLKEVYFAQGLTRPGVVLTIHNIAFQVTGAGGQGWVGGGGGTAIGDLASRPARGGCSGACHLKRGGVGGGVAVWPAP